MLGNITCISMNRRCKVLCDQNAICIYNPFLRLNQATDFHETLYEVYAITYQFLTIGNNNMAEARICEVVATLECKTTT